MPAQGRQIITFTDSLQGTARFALQAQQESDRNFARAIIYREIWQAYGGASADDVELSEREIHDLEAALQSVPESARHLFSKTVAEKKAALAKLRERATAGIVPWRELRARLARHPHIQHRMRPHLEKLYPAAALDSDQLADLLPFREFARCPRSANSLETLGLASIRYPKLDDVDAAPEAWLERGFTVEEYRILLKVLLDHFVRANNMARIDEAIARWMGTYTHTRRVTDPDALRDTGTFNWPVPRKGQRNRMVRLLSKLLGADGTDRYRVDQVDQILRTAWVDLTERRLLLRHAGTSQFELDLASEAEVQTVQKAWRCPVTRRVLDVVLRGVSPYQVNATHAARNLACQPR